MMGRWSRLIVESWWRGSHGEEEEKVSEGHRWNRQI